MRLDKLHSQMKKDAGMDVLMYILSHTKMPEKIFSRSYDEIQAATGASRDTIATTLRKLTEARLLVKISKTEWINMMVDETSNTAGGLDLYVPYRGQS